MKRILLLLSLLLAPSAFADDAVTSFGWNSVTGTFQAMTRGLGWKQIPDADSGTFSVTFTGPRTTTDTITWKRNGKIVTLFFPDDRSTACTAATSFTASGAVPSALRPAFVSEFAVFGGDNGVGLSAPLDLEISASGTVVIFKSWASGAGNFTASGSCGWTNSYITYFTN